MAKKLIYSYDAKADELNLSFGSPKGAVGLELEHEVFMQINPKTREVLGFTVPFFSKRLMAKRVEKSEAIFSGAIIVR